MLSICTKCIISIALCIPLAASAALGGTADSIRADQARIKAARTIAGPGNRYTVHESRLSSGTLVREYAASDGRVFAVTWKGPAKPDMNQLLGSYFSEYSKGSQASQASRRHFLIQRADLVILSEGHMRAFFGKAYLPRLLPAGVRIEELD